MSALSSPLPGCTYIPRGSCSMPGSPASSTVNLRASTASATVLKVPTLCMAKARWGAPSGPESHGVRPGIRTRPREVVVRCLCHTASHQIARRELQPTRAHMQQAHNADMLRIARTHQAPPKDRHARRRALVRICCTVVSVSVLDGVNMRQLLHAVREALLRIERVLSMRIERGLSMRRMASRTACSSCRMLTPSNADVSSPSICTQQLMWLASGMPE